LNDTLGKKIAYEYEGFKFLIRNLQAFRHLRKLEKKVYNDYVFSSLPKGRIDELDQLHKLTRRGRRLGFWRKILYRLRGESLCSVAINQNNKLVGYIIYYFREAEIPKGIIHEAFAGIAPEERAKGLATELTKYSFNQLTNQNLVGISGYVDKKNLASLKMIQKIGYEIVDDPDDPENNYYLYYPLT
jgi:ribosomal protein S18 acetylase RimI-like enzyme